jgi:protein-tyrosine-phosphatase
MRILFVCAGNLLRSVISECVFEARARELLGDLSGVFEVESSGLEAEEQGEWSSKRHPDCVHALEVIGLPAGLPAPTRTDSEHMARADIAVTMTRQQSYVMANRFPENKRKCFSLLEVNGALWTLSDGRPGGLEEGELSRLAVETGEDGLRKGLDRVAESLTGTSRELLMPLEGVRLNVRELMTLFAPCFYQVSGVHDPMGGTDEEISRCARQLDGEVSRMLYGLVRLALGST